MRDKDAIICGIIYLATFAFMLHYDLVNPLVNDRVYEYREYLANVASGWQYRNNLLNSCLLVTWVPAVIQRWTGWDAMLVFKIFPPFFYALMPVFTYLIARKYLEKKWAVVSALVVIFSSCILFFPDMGRVGIALGFMSGMVWALLERKVVWAVVFGTLVVFSHYSTTLIAIGAVGLVCAAVLLQRRLKLKQWYTEAKPYIVTVCLLIILMGIWNFGLAKYSGSHMFSTLLQPEKARAIMGEDWGRMSIWNLEDRDLVAQKGLGVTFVSEPIPGKIEIVANWLVIACLTVGLYTVFRKRALAMPLLAMSGALYGLLVATIAIPELSQYYGTSRVFFTGLMVLAVCFPFGVKWVSSKLHVQPLIVASVVLALYAASTSGLVYLPFDLVKVLPVVVSFP